MKLKAEVPYQPIDCILSYERDVFVFLLPVWLYMYVYVCV